MSFNRPFGAYRFGFVLLYALVLIELVAASIAGSRFLNLAPSELYQMRELRLGLTGWFLIPLAWLAMISVALAKRKIEYPTRTLFRIVRRNRDWLLRGFLLAVIHVPIGRAFSTLKSSIPFIDRFGWDPRFAAIDHLLLGSDAWLLTHRFIGEVGTVALDRTYALWGTYLILLVGWISFTRKKELQIKAAIAFNLCWFFLGIVLATLFASAGPCFFDDFHGGQRFAGLMSNLGGVNETHGLIAFKAMNYLLENADTAKLGAGISAMPSLHVSMATLGIVLAFAARAKAWIKVFVIVFTLAIVIGSVHLGWHYLVDSLVSIPATLFIWFASSRVVNYMHTTPIEISS